MKISGIIQLATWVPEGSHGIMVQNPGCKVDCPPYVGNRWEECVIILFQGPALGKSEKWLNFQDFQGHAIGLRPSIYVVGPLLLHLWPIPRGSRFQHSGRYKTLLNQEKMNIHQEPCHAKVQNPLRLPRKTNIWTFKSGPTLRCF